METERQRDRDIIFTGPHCGHPDPSVGKMHRGLNISSIQTIAYKYKNCKRPTDGRTDGQTDKQTDKRTDIQTDIQTDCRTDRQTYGRMDGQTYYAATQGISPQGVWSHALHTITCHAKYYEKLTSTTRYRDRGRDK